MGQLILRNHAKKIRLILVFILRAQEAVKPVALFNAREMTGGQLLRAQRHGEIEKRRELDLAVAQNVRIGRSASFVFGKKMRKHAVHIFLGIVDRIIRNADRIADVSDVRPILLTGADAVFVLFFPVVHKYADDVVSLALQKIRGNRGIHAAGHADNDSHMMCSFLNW